MYIGVKADDPQAVAWAQEFARQRGWIDVRVESWLYVSGEAPPLLSEAEGSAWPAPPFKVRTTTADVMIFLDDLVTPWGARPGGVVPLDRAPTKIGSRCYIGPHAVICKGVTIGDGCVVGAHSLVQTDIPAGSRAHGSPVKVRGT